ncbi:MAG: DNA ligase D [Myxococcota bacterium]
MPKTGPDRRSLETYRAKRTPGGTPEPMGVTGVRPRLFVVQQHAARRLHHDFRLEWRNVLLSWAVPRGPSLDPAVKRLAVHVEDHPVDYADFEGVIPEGNYGAGAVIVWDLGRWTPLEDVEEGLRRGKLLFDLDGYKLHGTWTLVRTGGRAKPDSKEWLLIKKPDSHARPDEEAAALPAESVLSGLTLEELGGGSKRIARMRRRLKRSGAPRRDVPANSLRPMLAERRDRPFDRPGWLFEVKYDGYRCLIERRADVIRLRSRRGRDLTPTFPELARAVRALPIDHAVLDGEIVAPDAEGRPVFQRLQRRAQLRRPREVERAALEIPVAFFAFDLLALEDHDLRPLPLLERKALLEMLIPARGALRFSSHFEERGKAVYREITQRRLEGMMAKKADSPYVSRRSSHWQKLRALRTDDFVVLGFTHPGRGRRGFGALHLGAFAGSELRYLGRVGSGFDEARLDALRAELDASIREAPACPVPAAAARDSRWVEPRLVCEVRYAELTSDGSLRQPVFLHLRDDKTPEECLHPEPSEAEPVAVEASPDPEPEPRDVPFTNLDKVFWPEEGFSKGDLIDYHRRVAPWILPYLADRPLVLTRYPDGILGKSFFQKDAPQWVPSWVRTERMWSEHASREIHYFVCDELEQLLYVVNLGTIPLHVWSSRVASLQQPDWCILDLDPKGAPFADVVRVARELRTLCRSIELPSYAKTSGSTGVHVLIPLGRQLTFEQSRQLALVLARAVVGRLPEIATVTRRVSARKGRVYVDALQNGHGRLLAAPFCVRPLPDAPVSMPVRWREVSARLDPGRYTLRTAAARLRRLGEDPLRPVLEDRPDLLGALERLQELVGN